MIEKEKLIKRLKKGIWLYFLLLFFEGALRKWILPQLSTPLLIVRDPIAIYIIVQTLRYRIWKPEGWVMLAWLVTVLGMVFTFLGGHGNIFVTVYGMRIMIIHFPLIFIFGKILTLYDVERMGKYLLWITIGMTILVALQFFSPQSAFLNRGIAGEEGSGFSGAAGFYRVPGTFSFTNGLSLFYGLAGTFIIYFLVRKKELVRIPKYLIIGALIAIIAAVPLSISRSVFFQLLLTVLFLLFVSGRDPKILSRIVVGIFLIILIFFAIQNFAFFETATMAFNERLTKASNSEGGTSGIIIDRFLGGLINSLKTGGALFGKGIGLGTNAGARLVTGEAGGFLIAEDEWARIIGERGFILGIIIILIRIGILVKMTLLSWKNIAYQNILPWLILSFAAVNILMGQWSQPTSLGFAIVAGGFIMATLKN